MNQRVKYDFRNKEGFAALFFPAIFLPLYLVAEIPIAIKICLYVLPSWLLFSFNFSSVRITPHAIIVINYIKPFRKIYRYTYKDLLGLNIHTTKKGWLIRFIFPGNKKAIRGGFNRMENLCRFLLDKKIPVISSSGEAWHFINQYQNDPKANYIRQQLRKAKRRNINPNIPS